MNDIKGAIFDLDGTLVDSMYVWQKVDVDFLSRRGFDVPADYSKIIKTMHFETAARYTIERFNLDETADEVISEWLNMAVNEYRYNVKLKTKAKELLQKLYKTGIKIAMATSSNPMLTEPVLENNGVLDLFSAVCYTSQVGRDKSNPDVYLLAAKSIDVSPTECVVFEDIINGIRGAKKANMKTVAVYDKESENEIELLKLEADLYIKSFEEVL